MSFSDPALDERVKLDILQVLEMIMSDARGSLSHHLEEKSKEYLRLYGHESQQFEDFRRVLNAVLETRGVLRQITRVEVEQAVKGSLRERVSTSHGAPFREYSESAAENSEGEGFNDSIFDGMGARGSFEVNPEAIPPPPPAPRPTALPIPPDAEVPSADSSPPADSVGVISVDSMASAGSTSAITNAVAPSPVPDPSITPPAPGVTVAAESSSAQPSVPQALPSPAMHLPPPPPPPGPTPVSPSNEFAPIEDQASPKEGSSESADDEITLEPEVALDGEVTSDVLPPVFGEASSESTPEIQGTQEALDATEDVEEKEERPAESSPAYSAAGIGTVGMPAVIAAPQEEEPMNTAAMLRQAWGFDEPEETPAVADATPVPAPNPVPNPSSVSGLPQAPAAFQAPTEAPAQPSFPVPSQVSPPTPVSPPLPNAGSRDVSELPSGGWGQASPGSISPVGLALPEQATPGTPATPRVSGLPQAPGQISSSPASASGTAPTGAVAPASDGRAAPFLPPAPGALNRSNIGEQGEPPVVQAQSPPAFPQPPNLPPAPGSPSVSAQVPPPPPAPPAPPAASQPAAPAASPWGAPPGAISPPAAQPTHHVNPQVSPASSGWSDSPAEASDSAEDSAMPSVGQLQSGWGDPSGAENSYPSNSSGAQAPVQPPALSSPPPTPQAQAHTPLPDLQDGWGGDNSSGYDAGHSENGQDIGASNPQFGWSAPPDSLVAQGEPQSPGGQFADIIPVDSGWGPPNEASDASAQQPDVWGSGQSEHQAPVPQSWGNDPGDFSNAPSFGNGGQSSAADNDGSFGAGWGSVDPGNGNADPFGSYGSQSSSTGYGGEGDSNGLSNEPSIWKNGAPPQSSNVGGRGSAPGGYAESAPSGMNSQEAQGRPFQMKWGKKTKADVALGDSSDGKFSASNSSLDAIADPQSDGSQTPVIRPVTRRTGDAERKSGTFPWGGPKAQNEE